MALAGLCIPSAGDEASLCRARVHESCGRACRRNTPHNSFGLPGLQAQRAGALGARLSADSAQIGASADLAALARWLSYGDRAMSNGVAPAGNIELQRRYRPCVGSSVSLAVLRLPLAPYWAPAAWAAAPQSRSPGVRLPRSPLRHSSHHTLPSERSSTAEEPVPRSIAHCQLIHPPAPACRESCKPPVDRCRRSFPCVSAACQAVWSGARASAALAPRILCRRPSATATDVTALDLLRALPPLVALPAVTMPGPAKQRKIAVVGSRSVGQSWRFPSDKTHEADLPSQANPP